jgi:hypothetical protein
MEVPENYRGYTTSDADHIECTVCGVLLYIGFDVEEGCINCDACGSLLDLRFEYNGPMTLETLIVGDVGDDQA